MNYESTAFNVIKHWAVYSYKNKTQERAALQSLIITALERAYRQGLLDAETANNQKLGLYDASN